MGADIRQIMVWSLMESSRAGDFLHELDAAIALARTSNAVEAEQKLMFIFNNTNERLMIPFSTTVREYQRQLSLPTNMGITVKHKTKRGPKRVKITLGEILNAIRDVNIEILTTVFSIVEESNISIDPDAIMLQDAI